MRGARWRDGVGDRGEQPNLCALSCQLAAGQLACSKPARPLQRSQRARQGCRRCGNRLTAADGAHLMSARHATQRSAARTSAPMSWHARDRGKRSEPRASMHHAPVRLVLASGAGHSWLIRKRKLLRSAPRGQRQEGERRYPWEAHSGKWVRAGTQIVQT